VKGFPEAMSAVENTIGRERKKFMKRGGKLQNRNRRIDAIVFGGLLIMVSMVTLVLFYRQTMGSPEKYHSDMKAYILEMQGLESGYEFPYPVFFKLGAFLHLFAPPEMSVAIATMLLNSLGMVVTKLAFNRLALQELENSLRQRGGRRKRCSGIWQGEDKDGRGQGCQGSDPSWIAGVLISLAAISLFFISMLFPPSGIYLPGIHFHYLGVFSANPFHNATYMAARPFAILAFLWFGKLLPVYERGIGKAAGEGAMQGEERRKVLKDYLLFSFFLLIATMTKPSFTLVLVSTAGLLMLYRLFRAKFRTFVPTLQLGLCFIPTFLDLLYQYRGVFMAGEGEEGGVGFCFGEVWAKYCSNLPLAVCLAMGFPLLVLVLNGRASWKDTLARFSWMLYLVSFAEAFLLYEKGFRKYDFNFSWGYMYGIFFCHFSMLLLLVRITAQRIAEWNQEDTGRTGEIFEENARRAEKSPSKNPNKNLWSVVLLGLQWFAFLCHVICGLRYFGRIFGGAMYY